MSRQLHPALCNRDFPIARCHASYIGLYVTAISQSRACHAIFIGVIVTAISQSRMILANGAHRKLDSKRLSEHL